MMKIIKDLGYQNLFQGAVRLGLSLGALELPWPYLAPYVSTFSEELNAYQELSHGGAATMGLMTRGCEKGFAFRVARYMESHGVDENRLRLFLVRAKFFEYRNLFFKVEVGATGPMEFSYYFRRRASLEVAQAWLANAGIDREALEILEECARQLQKHSVHFLAAAERPAGESLQKVYFSQPEDGNAWERIRSAGRLVGLTNAVWDSLAPYCERLGNGSPFFSLTFTNGQLCPGAKLDIGRVAPDIVEDLMKSAGRTQEEWDRARLLLELFAKKEFDYLGLTVRPDAPMKTKVYVYQNSAPPQFM